jgi:hypothetical protein
MSDIQPEPVDSTVPAVTQTTDNKKLNSEFKARIEACKTQRRKLIRNWVMSIDYRRGKPFQSQTDEDRVAVNLDWILTKSKTATLFSQVPKVRLDHDTDLLPKNAPWAMPFEKKLNDTLVGAGIESAMDECLPDCINAAGLGVILVSYEAITEDRQMPIGLPSAPSPQQADPNAPPVDPTAQSPVPPQADPNAPPPQMDTIPFVVAKRYLTERISPADFLWPINFTGSNFDNADWVGRSGRLTWAIASQRFKLSEEDKAKVLDEGTSVLDKLTHDVDRDRSNDELVSFDEIFYKTHSYDPDAKAFEGIHHLVFLHGKSEPVVDEPWKGQKIAPDNSILGARKFPLRVLTLNYVTDETIPPSDSAISRPQVDELNMSRTQMIQQRQRSLPIRAVDINRLDSAVLQSMMKGTWQQFIPVQGDGSRVITEISRAQMPNENFMFDKIAKADTMDLWGMGQESQNQAEAHGDENQNKSGFNTIPGRERAKVASFFVSVAEVLGGLLCLYEEPGSLGEGFSPEISKTLCYSILADSTVLLDAGQKLSRINQFFNLYAKTGWVNIEAVLSEVATLTGLDASSTIKAPEPKPPVEPNISLRLTGVEDMLNPLALAFLIKSGQAPPPELIEQAKQLIQQSVVPPQGMQMPGQVQPQGGLPMLPTPQGGVPPGPPLAPPVGAPPPGHPMPQPPVPPVGEAHPQLSAMPQILKRSEPGGKQ